MDNPEANKSDVVAAAEAVGVPPSAQSALQDGAASLSLVQQIEKLRRNLLDIGTRNRLISAPLRSSRANVLEIVDEKADHVFAALWRDNSAFTFIHNETHQPSPQADTEFTGADEGAIAVYIPPDDAVENGATTRHGDTKLQTRLQAEPLQKRLLTLQRDSYLFEEEQGTNILFFAIGFLKWFEADSSDIERFAPLLLIPVALERDKVRSRFRLRRREEDIEVNLSLQAKLKQDFGISLPELPDSDDWLPTDYYRLVGDAISTKARWAVEQDSMLLGFFSFSKFLLYRDLDPDQWPEVERIDQNPLVNGLLVEGFDEDPLPIGENHNLDDLLDPADLGHVMDADASQAAVIEMAAGGRSMVVQGPPGTGKSQTIANVIAAAARQGKTILFIAEKMAALEVVHDRLRASGLDALCLELHSHKANKKAVLDELKRTLELGRVSSGARDVATETKIARDELNELSKLLHSPLEGQAETPFQIVALLVKFREDEIEPPNFVLDLELTKSAEGHRRAIAALEALASRTAKGGPSANHPWRGVSKRLTPIDMQRLRPQLEQLRSTGKALSAALEAGTELFGMHSEDDGNVGKRLLRWLDHFVHMPIAIKGLLEHAPVRRNPDEARALLAAAQEVAAAYAVAVAHTSEVGIAQEWSATRQTVAARGRSLLRFLSGDFRRAVALIDSVSVIGPASTHEERLRRLDSIVSFQLVSRRLADDDERAKATFGTDWRGHRTETENLDSALKWYAEARKLPELNVILDDTIRSAPDGQTIGLAASTLKETLDNFEAQWLAVRGALELNVATAFIEVNGEPGARLVVDRISAWLDDFDRLDEWFSLAASERECRALGLDPIVERVANGVLSHEHAVDAYKFARAEAIWGKMIAAVPRLASIRGDERTSLVQRFRDLERELFVTTAREIAAKHTADIPAGAQGQMGYVRGQIARRRGHASIRKLIESAGEAVQKIKPIFLMSPISVAQFLPPGSLTFDLVLMDEASQVRPEDAIGAIARGGSVVVVGDSKQLPPTSFFDRTIGAIADDADDDDPDALSATTVSAGAMESILTLCQARGMPARTLQWHYRSRHPSLIQVSNQAFYEHKLKFPPSPERAGRDGLIFRRLNGVYDRGKTRTNPMEAHAVAEAVIAHARECPDLSLGVATLSVAQRDAILADLELLRSRHSELESFFDRSKHEAFFVKNLENVQGDERDVMFVSICYARDSDGYMSQGFGPVSSEGGERRLNVLFTRAKRRCEVFSSISHADIELRGTSVSVGRRVLHTYLKFAETGQTDSPLPTGLAADSEFEIAVGNRIRSAGYEVDFQVGSAGFRIDIGVRDPSSSNSYVLGVECDGAAYHSALWARERDRLRQQVLESKGWRLHRIWSTDWFNRPDAEFRKLLTAIDRAKAAHASEVEAEREAHEAAIKIERETASDKDKAGQISMPYREADIPRLDSYAEPHLVPPGLMARYVADVVSVEQPVHTDEVAKRVARAWGAQRTGTRIRASVEKALTAARVDGKIQGGPFWVLPDGVVQVRDRSRVSSTSLRQPDYLPPTEIDEAIKQTIARSVAITPDEVARGVAEALGFNATSAPLKGVVLERVKSLIQVDVVNEVDGLLRLASA